jgi:superfamily II DNA or RNA helicase
MYLGQKGFTIPKGDVSSIKKDLTFTPKAMYQPGPPFYVYRENANKIYVPRFYGEKRFGVAPSKLPPPIPISVDFKGTIRSTQVPAIEAFLAAGSGLLELPCGFGKTVLALHLISKISFKTLIIVHKEFLLEQWLERIREFLPTARIGRIQGTTCDVEGKDIVLGMLQSLSMKEYEPQVFAGFGFSIIDETHHIAAEVFSNALFKIVTPHMLGLSATMERNDGLSKVFKLFIGEIVYSAARERTDNVVVQCLRYEHPDPEFNETILNFKGQANFTAMIGKVCAFGPRTEFILTVLAHLVQTAAQIMVLAQNRSILDYLHAALKHRGQECAFYVGGMKAADLKASESSRIILATFAMAKEGLDIKTLTTLVLATSQTDVTQAVGRILRVKHDAPLIVDIVDPHPTFGRQWSKRKTFYKSQGYSIVQSTSTTYPVMQPLGEKVRKCLLL